jgi:hypothetical protein
VILQIELRCVGGFVDTSKEVGDPDHLKVFAEEVAATRSFDENDPEGVALNMM